VIVRDLILLAFGVLVMIAIYQGTIWGLKEVRAFSHLAYLSPFTPMAILFLMLLGMLLISTSVTALGTLYLSRDLSLLLSSPLTPWQFYYGKFFYILYSTVWMPFVFIIPFVLAYGAAFDATATYYFVATVALIPYFLIPVGVSMLVITVLTAIIPASRSREVLVLVVLLFLAAIWGLAEIISWGASSSDDLGQVLRLLSILSVPDALWLPSHWVAIALRDALEQGGRVATLEVLMLTVVAGASISLSFLSLLLFHGAAHTRASNTRHGYRLSDWFFGGVMQRLAFRFGSQPHALLIKDARIFLREITQAVQLLLLVGVYLIYLYNLKIFKGLETLPLNTQVVWRAFIFVVNVAMGAFVTTAVCTRFVFPAISLEGKSFWILQSSPLSLKRMIRIKFWEWFVPIGFISGLVFASGAFAIGADWWEVTVNYLAGWMITFGIVGLGTGLGAQFANFDWEHSSQLAASFGSLVFMLTSILLITVNMIPVGILGYARRPGMFAQHYSDANWLAVVGLCGAFIIALNVYTCLVSLRLGEEELVTKMYT
jgi:ABC-2 type transport system permease protein